jgi:hypothetical protein
MREEKCEELANLTTTIINENHKLQQQASCNKATIMAVCQLILELAPGLSNY